MVTTVSANLRHSIRRGAPLDLTNGVFYAFLLILLFLFLDPFYSGYGAFRVTRDVGPLKYAPLIVGLGAAFLSVVGIQLRPMASRPPWRATLADAWPLLAFGTYVLAGSLVARLHLDVRETFLQLGAGVLGLPIAVTLFWAVRDGMRLARRYLLALLLVAPYMFGWIVLKRFEGGQAFHTEIFLLVPLAVYYYIALDNRWTSRIVVLFCLMAGIVSHKNTAYIITLMTVCHIATLHLKGRVGLLEPVRRAVTMYLLWVVVALSIMAIAFLIINREDYLPSGNVAVREETYYKNIERWTESPVYGSGFAGTTLVELDKLLVLGRDQVIAHSDWLDILSHGGLIGFLLFVYGFWRILGRCREALALAPTQEVRALIHGLGAIVASGLIVALFNAPLLTLPTALPFWFATGLLIAVSHRSRVNYGQKRS